MTYQELYQLGKKELKKAGVDTPAFDAICLFSHCCGMDRTKLIVHGNEEVIALQAKAFLQAIAKRAARYPLQYLLGEWEFMGLPFFVGEGVLVPREDTEVLVNTALVSLQNVNSPRILDLCAGSGAVSIGFWSQKNDAEVTAVELSQTALGYLQKNIVRHGANVTIKQRDVLLGPWQGENESFDAVLSNPPYIPSKDIATLQPEVQKEPPLALDGGEDGLLFYRVIGEKWLPCLKPGGFLAVEIGVHRAEAVEALFLKCGLKSIKTVRDFNNMERVVTGWKIG